MASQVQRTISLMKRAYDQPILFHILHCHLVFLLSATTPTYEITDDWSKILVYSAYPNKLPNQGLELKIQDFLRRIRPPLDEPDKKLKLMVICYYLLNRPPALINHIILFELVSHFLGHSEYFDGLIIKILGNMLTAKLYGVEQNKKLSAASTEKMIELVLARDLSLSNQIRALPCFIGSDIKPFDLGLTTIDHTYLGYKYLEMFCLYAKYCKNASYITSVLPSNVSFIEGLKEYMSYAFPFAVSGEVEVEKAAMEDRRLYDEITRSFEEAPDKHRFVSDIIEFVSKFSYS